MAERPSGEGLTRLRLSIAAVVMSLFLISLEAERAGASVPVDAFIVQPSTSQAGGHPDLLTSFRLSSRSVQQKNSSCNCEDPKDIIVSLPAGVIGDPHSVPRCTASAFALNKCPTDSQVGLVEVDVGITVAVMAKYNLVPRPEEPGLLGFKVPGFESSLYRILSARTGSDYGLNAGNRSIPRTFPLTSYREVIWGVPADPSHDSMRFPFGKVAFLFTTFCNEKGLKSKDDLSDIVTYCTTLPFSPPAPQPSSVPPKPFLQNPTSCGEPLVASIEVLAYDLETEHAEYPWPATTGCDQLSFNPSLAAQPTTEQSDSASGLDVELTVPQFTSPTVPSPSAIKETTVTLPVGFSINPNAADGKAVCLDVQARYGTEDAAQCPEFSKVGTLSIESAVLPGPLPGYVYLSESRPGDRYRIVLVADGFGLHIKLPGSVKADSTTGQLVAEFRNLPQTPFQKFDLHFFGSERGLLATPTHCGTYAVETTFVPWNGELANQSSTQFFTITSGAGGGPCSPERRSFSPSLTAGVEDNTASVHSPFVLELARNDGEQLLRALNVATPPGFSGVLKGIDYCPEAAISAAAAQGYSGRQEMISPSCPASSQIGTAAAGAGAGSNPLHVLGKVFLAGPYRGAPLSLAVITPAVSGPYDLGAAVVRAALFVDPVTARVTAVSDPLPQILEGVPLRLRSVLINLDRPNFILNPTNCDPFSVDTTVFGDQGAEARPSTPFQVANCADLGFRPKLTLRLVGGTKRTGHPALKATIGAAPGEANIASTAVTLPDSLILDNARIQNPCTKVQFAATACPEGSVLGSARAQSPLLANALEGRVYLRSSSNKLPDMVIDLRGQINVVLVGRIDAVNDRLRTTFERVPDVPVTEFALSLFGGSRGLLTNRFNICKTPLVAAVRMGGQNGGRVARRTRMQVPCAKSKSSTLRRSGDRPRIRQSRVVR